MSIAEQIPKILHKIWLGGLLPVQERAWLRSWELYMAEWKVIIWDDRTILDLDAPHSKAWLLALSLSEKSDLLRFEILNRFGGIYTDTDVECLRSFDAILTDDAKCFLGLQRPNQVCGAVMGSIPQHPFIQSLVDHAPKSFAEQRDPDKRGGPVFLTKQLQEFHSSVKVFPEHYFYPYWFGEREDYPIESDFRGLFPESYAVHHWMFSWGKKRNVQKPNVSA